ncbi:amino acid adenylation domain-containing protein [Sphingobacterium sp. Mn56C]|uniref:amino acid adenylation domain-containing protein n=1 Tax=Sphingobacterium sp. Mn56C TaxID=3395261 RepID=UPI003BCA2A57
MQNDLHNPTHASHIIQDSNWHRERIRIAPEIWSAIQEKSKHWHLPADRILEISVILALKTWLDLPVLVNQEAFHILRNNELYVSPIPTFHADIDVDRSFISYCTDIKEGIIPNLQSQISALSDGILIVMQEPSPGNDYAAVRVALCVHMNTLEGLRIDWQIKTDFMAMDRVKALTESQQKLLFWAANTDWKQPLPDLLNAAERHTRNEINQTSRPGVAQCMHDAFFKNALTRPQQVALLWEDKYAAQLSYDALSTMALKLARALVDCTDNTACRIAILLPKGPAQVIAALGILGSGGTYIPIAVDQPYKRIQKILTTAAAQFLVTDSASIAAYPYLKDLTQAGSIKCINIDETAHLEPLAAPVQNHPSQLAYIIFTSGSTGAPKGVEITHGAAWNTINDVNNRFVVQANDRILAVSAFDFDLSVYDIFGLLSAGGSVVLLPEEKRKEPSIWLSLLEKYKITIWNSVPALFDMLLLTASERDNLGHLRLVLLSGDWVGLTIKERLKKVSVHSKLIALGGATEASIWSNYYVVDAIQPGWISIPYGKPLANQKYRVVNSLGMDCPETVTGELWIGGQGLARGYTANKSLTDSRFVYANGERWYRTGDLGRYAADGNLEFLGRLDQQVKINGFRIELGEIEAALKTIPGVAQATAVVLTLANTPHLIAAVVPRQRPAMAIAEDSCWPSSSSPAPTAAVRVAYKRQQQVVAEVIFATLQLATITVSATKNRSAVPLLPVQIEQLKMQVTAHLEIAPEHMPTIDMWLNWLQNRHLLVEKGGRLFLNGICQKKYATQDSALTALNSRLQGRIPMLQQILSNNMPALALLDDELLAPEKLSSLDRGMINGIDRLAKKINQQAEISSEPLKVAILGAGSGLLSEQLLHATAGKAIRYWVVDEGHSLLRSFTKRQAAAGHLVTPIERRQHQIPEAYRYDFDIVVAINSLHSFQQPEEGLFICTQLLCDAGYLWALEPETLMPIALLSAGVIERGFQHFDAKRRDSFNPMMNSDSWRNYFQKTGFITSSCEKIRGSNLMLYQCQCPAGRPQLKVSHLLRQLKDLLPAHMLPERLFIFPHMPLSANGKLDRRELAAQLKNSVNQDMQTYRTNIEGPVGVLEEGIAGLWKELLDIKTISRDDIFFEIGGDSLSATRFLGQVREQYAVDLKLSALFGATLWELAFAIQQEQYRLQEEWKTMETGEI